MGCRVTRLWGNKKSGILRRLFGPNMVVGTAEWGSLHNEEIYDLRKKKGFIFPGHDDVWEE
jgi:hypothetical protein